MASDALEHWVWLLYQEICGWKSFLKANIHDIQTIHSGFYGLFQCVWCHKSICPNISSGVRYQKLKVNSLNVGRFIFIFHILNKIKIVMVMHAGVRKSKLDYRN